LLAKPDILFLDEATSAIDEEGEAMLYKLIAAKLPKATVISIGHRSTLLPFHKDWLKAERQADGTFRMVQAANA
jgi:putative ATP-binding cassette transporter